MSTWKQSEKQFDELLSLSKRVALQLAEVAIFFFGLWKIVERLLN
jgi:hypothetical protein